MRSPSRNARRAAASAMLALAALGAGAVVPLLIAGLGKQIVQNLITNAIKGQLIASLSSMGCKGAKLAGVLATIDTRHGIGGRLPPGMPGGGMMPGGMLPGMGGAAGGHMPVPPAGMPPGLSGTAGAAGAARQAGSEAQQKAEQAGAAMPGPLTTGIRGNGTDTHGAALTVSPEEMARIQGGQMDMGQMMALAQQRMGSRGPGGAQMSPEQMARAQETMSQMSEAMAHPLTREQTLGVFDELKSMGVLNDDMLREARECILLASPEASAQMGSSGAMIQAVVLPKLREVKSKLADLPPDQQAQLAEEVAESLKTAKPGDRKTFLDGLGVGFFPAGVSDAVRAKLQRE